MEKAMNVVLHDVPWDRGEALRVTVGADGGEHTTMGHLWRIAAEPTTWQYSIETEFNPSDTKALKFEAASRVDLYNEVVNRIRIVKIPPDRLADQTMHALAAKVVDALADTAKATKSQQGFMGAIYGAVAKFAVSEVKPEKREDFLQRAQVDIRDAFNHYLEMYNLAKEMADGIQEAMKAVVENDDSTTPPIH